MKYTGGKRGGVMDEHKFMTELKKALFKVQQGKIQGVLVTRTDRYKDPQVFMLPNDYTCNNPVSKDECYLTDERNLN